MTPKGILDIGVLSVTILAMLVVGMGIKMGQFRHLLSQKRILVLVLVGQTVMPPIIGYLMARLIVLPPQLIAGILLLAACPVGDLANFYAYLARANVPLSLSVNALSCLLSFLTMPAVFLVYGFLLGGTFPLAAPPLTLILRVLWMVVLPVLLGMGMNHVRPALVMKYSATLRNCAVGGVGFLTLYILATYSDILEKDWILTAAASTLFIGVAAVTGIVAGRLLKLTRANNLTVGILFSVRNVGFALAVAITVLNTITYSVFAVVYFLTEVPLLLAGLGTYRRWEAARDRKARSLTWT